MNAAEWISIFREAYEFAGVEFTTEIESFILSPRQGQLLSDEPTDLFKAKLIFLHYFYKQAALGNYYGLAERATMATGESVESFYRLTEGPFVKLARAYWSLYKEGYDFYQNEKPESFLSDILDFTVVQITNDFFPTVDLPRISPEVLKQNQSEILSEYFSKDDVERFLKESPVLKAYSGIGGIIEHNLWKFLNHVNILQPGYEERLREWASLGGATAQGVMAGASGDDLAHAFADKFNHNFDDYDKAIDAAYNAGIGGSSQLHHLLDGQHSVWGAVQAVKDVSGSDTFFREFYEASEHLLRDLCSVSGINPIFSIDREAFNGIAGLVFPLGVSKSYLADALTVNAPEMIGAGFGLCALLLGSKSKDSRYLGELSGALIAAMFASANPVLLPVAGFSMYQAVKKCENKQWGDLFCSLGKGALVTGATVAVSGLVGGNWVLKLAAGVATAVCVRAGINNVEKSWKQIWPAFQRLGQQVPEMAHSVSYN